MSFSMTPQSMVEETLSRTPPNFAPSSYEFGHLKRTRAGSISGRLRAASDLEERGYIDKSQKGVLKDLIITGSDPQVQTALEKYEHGDPTEIQGLLHAGHLNRKHSIDLLDDLDLNFLNMNSNSKHEEIGGFELGDFSFEESFDEAGVFNTDNYPFSDLDGIGQHHMHALSDDIGEVPSAGLGTTPPYPLHFQPDIFAALAADFEAPAFHGSAGSISSMTRPRGLSTTSPTIVDRKPAQNTAHPKAVIKTEPTGQSQKDTSHAPSRSHTYPQASQQATQQGSQQPAAASYMSSQRHQHGSNTHTSNSPVQNGTGSNYFSKPTPSAAMPMPKPQLQHSQSLDSKDDKKYVGAYSPESRKKRIERYLEKRKRRVWTKKVKYDVRKNFADSRLRVKGRFVKKEDEELLRELMNIT